MFCRMVMTESASLQRDIQQQFLESVQLDMSLLRNLCASVRVSPGPALDRFFAGAPRAASGAAKDKEPLRKAKTPQGRFDSPEERSRDVLEKFPDDVNPITKEKGGPRGPEPTRYGDWERKGRCVDF
ncbi:succinate dehydrogenase assembly factor 4, mitochondrial [Echeneis naucrates]|uniref:Succinate dehydrogenase assembly factor 4, mitochondrial n=1 Tax=Echeneis naucrates TaxID=173247 RepID=A0A665TN51_ECHNA|nr:succinate dehydrogenase assembly factor 4, mitochondrial [Echeneis naucrates]